MINNNTNSDNSNNTNNNNTIIIIMITIIIISSNVKRVLLPTSSIIGYYRKPRVDTTNPPTKSLDFRGFDSSKLLILKGGNSHVHQFYRESPGKFDSRTLSRETLSRWTGRIRHSNNKPSNIAC